MKRGPLPRAFLGSEPTNFFPAASDTWDATVLEGLDITIGGRGKHLFSNSEIEAAVKYDNTEVSLSKAWPCYEDEEVSILDISFAKMFEKSQNNSSTDTKSEKTHDV